jgi:glucosamine--fructose-6-phosphate aminotransferase (isomerizing)
MCGIFGVVSKGEPNSEQELRRFSDSLFKLSESRGKEAAGIALLAQGKIFVLKVPFRASKFVKEKFYKELFEKIDETSLKKRAGFIGHSRLATHGFQTKNENNQPVTNSLGTIIHNGIVVNEKKIWELIGKKPSLEVDTEALLELITYYEKQDHGLKGALKKAFSKIKGSASLALFAKTSPHLYLATNTGSLYFCHSTKEKFFVFASEKYILERFKQEDSVGKNFGKVEHLGSKKGLVVSLDSLKLNKFSLDGSSRKKKERRKKETFQIKEIKKEVDPENVDVMLYSKKNSLKALRKHDFDYKAINSLRRCTRCILPETMPFIEFDDAGICNYCRNHKKIQPKGKKKLENLVEPFKSKNGEPDSILAFSGGRDSSYGLHFLKKELGLNPIAYTYDWGMVTDLARRNEARMIGELGVEHIIVSADISMKRDHIRKHILAWMKKPDLGMVPLFMEGDKQCEYYADELARKTGIDLIFYTRGNELENEEFKWGQCGIRNATPGGVIHDLSTKGKLKIASYYASQYLKNPAYINSSIFDTLFAYFSTYVQKHDYIFLWHYIKWDEDKIVSTLKDKYGWETEKGTTQTWRTDDGTSAFYNYIYYAGQGFTENDTFRSNQIREETMDRKTALLLVNKENKPRYRALKWYFDLVGLDGDEVLSVVDSMPKLY